MKFEQSVQTDQILQSQIKIPAEESPPSPEESSSPEEEEEPISEETIEDQGDSSIVIKSEFRLLVFSDQINAFLQFCPRAQGINFYRTLLLSFF